MGKLETSIQAFREYIIHNTWSILTEKDVQNGKQFQVSDSISKVPVICYTDGNILVQGEQSSLKTKLQEWATVWRKSQGITK